MTTVETKPVTVDEYKFFPEPTDGTRLELIRGEVVPMCLSNWEHGEIQLAVGSAIKVFLKSNPIGRVVVESGVITEQNPDTLRGPRVSFMSKDRKPLGVRMDKFADHTPDLCVEILSESNTRRQLNEKIKEYF